MRFVVAGSSGFLGTALRAHLTGAGHEVTRLVRRQAAAGESEWDPHAGRLDQWAVDAADVVINLGGAPLGGNPHSARWARAVTESRVETTRVLAEAVARSHTSGVGTPAYLAQNGTSFYGDHGPQVLPEDAGSQGDGFLTRVTRAWQQAAEPAIDAGARVCVLRTAPVMDRAAMPFKAMVPVFKLGLGARIGNGRQYFPVISLRDWVGAVTHLATGSADGPHNLCCPVTPTNAEFTEALALAVGRRARLRVPAAALVVAGRMRPELLGSVRTEPAALLREGFAFADADVRDVVAAALRR